MESSHIFQLAHKPFVAIQMLQKLLISVKEWGRYGVFGVRVQYSMMGEIKQISFETQFHKGMGEDMGCLV